MRLGYIGPTPLPFYLGVGGAGRAAGTMQWAGPPTPVPSSCNAKAEPPVTGLKARTDGLTDGLASKHMPSYQQKHRFQKLTNTSATLTQFVEASAFRLNISIDIKNAYNGPRVCFCDLHKI